MARKQMVAKTEGRYLAGADIHQRRQQRFPDFRLCLVSKKDGGMGGYEGGQMDDYIGMGYQPLSEEVAWTGHPSLVLMGIPHKEYEAQKLIEAQMNSNLDMAHEPISNPSGGFVESQTVRGTSERLSESISAADVSDDSAYIPSDDD